MHLQLCFGADAKICSLSSATFSGSPWNPTKPPPPSSSPKASSMAGINDYQGDGSDDSDDCFDASSMAGINDYQGDGQDDSDDCFHDSSNENENNDNSECMLPKLAIDPEAKSPESHHIKSPTQEEYVSMSDAEKQWWDQFLAVQDRSTSKRLNNKTFQSLIFRQTHKKFNRYY